MNRVFSDETIQDLLQSGVNNRSPSQPRARYHMLYIKQTKGLPNARFELRVKEMYGNTVYYNHHFTIVGDQTFVQVVRQLGTQYRIHRDNYEYIVQPT